MTDGKALQCGYNDFRHVMTARPNIRRFPLPETLADFFRMDRSRRVRVPDLAQLLGASDEEVRDVLRTEGEELRFDSIEWGEAAAQLFDAWPRTRILAALGSRLAQLIPPAFHLARVRWGIPVFIVRAIAHQAAVNGGRFNSPSIDDYVSDILFNEIHPSTVAAFAHDPAFLQAYHFPLD